MLCILEQKFGVEGSLGVVSADIAARFGVPTQPTLRIEAVRISGLEEREKMLHIGEHNHVARVGACKLGRTRLVVQVGDLIRKTLHLIECIQLPFSAHFSFIVGANDSQVHMGTPFDPIFLGEALQSTPRSYTFHFSTPIDVAVREAADMRSTPFSHNDIKRQM
jgi:hypothetical protein